MKGKVFYSISNRDISQIKPTFAFVPLELLDGDKLDREKYTAQRWDSINCGANTNSVGSHVFPDLNRPAKKEEYGKFLTEVKRLVGKSKGVATTHNPPGKGGFRKVNEGEHEIA
jgi:hypothetical protein